MPTDSTDTYIYIMAGVGGLIALVAWLPSALERFPPDVSRRGIHTGALI